MASGVAAYIATSVPLPNGQLASSGLLIPISEADDLLVHAQAENEFIKPFIDATIAEVIKDGVEIHVYRDSPEQEESDSDEGAEEEGGGDDDEERPLTRRKPPSEEEPDPNPDKSRPVPQEEQRKRKRKGERNPPKELPPAPPRFPEPKTRGREEIPLSPEERQHIRNAWNPANKELMRELVTHGMATVTVYTARNGHLSYAVQAWKTRQFFMRRNSVYPEPEYFVHYTDRRATTIKVLPDGKVVRGDTSGQLAYGARNGPTADIGTAEKPVLLYDPTVSVQDNMNNVGMEKMEGGMTHLIFVLYPPTADGRLTSPVMRSIPFAAALSVLRFVEPYVATARAMPLHVVATGPRQSGGIMGGGAGTTGREAAFGVTSKFANDDLLSASQAQEYTQTVTEQQRFMIAQQLSQQRGGATVGGAEVDAFLRQVVSSASTGQYRRAAPNLSAVFTAEQYAKISAPYEMQSLVLPPGQTLFAGPAADSLATLAHDVEWFKAELAANWQVPPQIINPQGSKYASDEKLVMATWTQKKQWYMSELAPMISEIYSAAHGPDGKLFTRLMMKALKTTNGKVSRYGDTFAVDTDKESARFKTPKVRGIAEVLSREDKDTVRTKIRSSLRVEASFNHATATNPEIATQLHGMNGIDTNTLISVLGAAAGLPRNRLLLTQAERDQAQKVKDMSARNSALALLPPAAPKGGGPAPKPMNISRNAPPSGSK